MELDLGIEKKKFIHVKNKSCINEGGLKSYLHANDFRRANKKSYPIKLYKIYYCILTETK